MKLKYAICEFHWLEGASEAAVPVNGVLYKPAAFESAGDQWWTVVVLLEKRPQDGETTIVLMTTLIEDAAENLIREGAVLEPKEGPRTIAEGRVLSVRYFRPPKGITLVEALKGVAKDERTDR